MPSRQQVHVQMRHCLAALFITVYDEAVAFFQIQVFRDLDGSQVHRSEYRRIFQLQIIVSADFLDRDDDDVNRGLRIDIVEGEAEVVAVDDLRRDFAVDDFLEDIVGQHGHVVRSPSVMPAKS